MLDLIYNTLFNNKQCEQFNHNNTKNVIFDYSKNQFEFEYNGKLYAVRVLEDD